MNISNIHDLDDPVVSFASFWREFLQHGAIKPLDPVVANIYVYDLLNQSTLPISGSTAVMLGYTTDEIEAMPSDGLGGLIHPEDLAAIAECYQRLFTLQVGEILELEYRMRRPDGTWCWLRSQETPALADSTGIPQKILGIVQEMSPKAQFCPRELTVSGKSLAGETDAHATDR